MGLFRREKRADANTLVAQYIRRADGQVFAQQVAPVDTDTAMAHHTVWACATLLADLVATTPVDAYRKSGGIRTQIDPAPLVLREPSVLDDQVAWLTKLMMSLLLSGNAFGYVTDSSGTFARRVEILDPQAVSFRQTPDGREEWRVNGVPEALWPVGNLWHVAGYVLPGQRLGLSVLRYAAAAVGLGAAAEGFGRDWFLDGAMPSAVLTSDQALTEEAAASIKQRWNDIYSRRREVAVLGNGMSVQPIQIAPEESQFLETINANVRTIARFFRVPVELLGVGADGTSLTYANVEERNLQLLTYTLAPWFVRVERALTALLPRPQFVKFNEKALLRTDAKTQSEVMATEISSGLLTVDEGRAKLDRPPLPEESEPEPELASDDESQGDDQEMSDVSE
jgi:HK97 family phage portal protein